MNDASLRSGVAKTKQVNYQETLSEPFSELIDEIKSLCSIAQGVQCTCDPTISLLRSHRETCIKAPAAMYKML